MKARLAALLLLIPLAVAPALAEPMKNSPRPKANPALVVSAPASAPALIGPTLPTAAAVASTSAIPAPPVNPRLGVITLSASNQVAALAMGPDMPDGGMPDGGMPDGGANSGAVPDLPLIGVMLPATMPEPQPRSSADATPQGATPVERTAPAATAVVATTQTPGLRPKARPKAVEKLAEAKAVPSPESAVATETANAALLTTSLRPKQRPKNIIQLASAAAPVAVPEEGTGKRKKKSKDPAPARASAKGSVCGVAAIKGENIAPITAKVQGCGLSDGVRVTSVSGVRLSMAATIDCTTAKALNTWVERVAQPAYGNQITELQIAGHYVCRSRNNKKGAKVSEHGRGKAVDISGFRLASGKVVRVLGGFDKTMRKAHKGACGIFGTTLGPGSDGYHEDHLHFDTASHRNGAYCR